MAINFRVTVCSMNSQKQPIYRECSGIKYGPVLLEHRTDEYCDFNEYDLSCFTGKQAWARMRWWRCWTWTPCSPSSPSSSPSTSVSPHHWSPPRCGSKSALNLSLTSFFADWRWSSWGQCSGRQHWEWVRRKTFFSSQAAFNAWCSWDLH